MQFTENNRLSCNEDCTICRFYFAPDVVAGAEGEALPPLRSQETRCVRTIRPRLVVWIRDAARPLVERGLDRAGVAAGVRASVE